MRGLRRTGRTEYGGRTEFEVAPHAEQFLRWAIGHFTSSWLTARARDGDIEEVARAFRLAVGVTDDLKALVRTIPVARWGVCWSPTWRLSPSTTRTGPVMSAQASEGTRMARAIR